MDEDGIRHIRGWLYRCFHDGDIVGREDGVFGVDADPDGTVFVRGKSFFFGRILGEFVSATGHWTQECTRREEGVRSCTEEDIWHLEDGRLLKFTVIFLNTDPSPTPYTGILLDPPGLRLGARQLRR